MKVLYYDCFSGISGDMNLGAMIDLGVDVEYLINELNKLKLSEEFSLEVKRDSRKGISGTKVDVILKEHHHHGHHHSQEHHHSRNLNDIEKLINSSELSDEIKEHSIKIFKVLAEAEASVHNKSIYEVHFHEVGAVDSIVDIVGAAICYCYLKFDKVVCSTVELGGGFVKCAHGIMPVPAPATAELLKGVPIKSGAVQFETTTPTGAAIIASIVDEFSDNKNFILKKVAYGIGTRDTEIPNVLRVISGELEENVAHEKEEIVVLETNIDDMNPEHFEYFMERALEKGALDIYFTPILMKKTRPAVVLTVLCKSDAEEALKSLIFTETTTLGIRRRVVERHSLARNEEYVDTKFGRVKVKLSYLNGDLVKIKPEYENCKDAALKNNVPLKTVIDETVRCSQLTYKL